MGLREIFRNSLTAKIVLILWLISSVLVLLSSKEVERTLIYGQFQTNYGLRYSAQWGVLYVAYMYSIYFLLAVPMALSAIVIINMVLDFWTSKKHGPGQECGTHTLISCPSCGKVFGRSLAVLDFSTGTPKIVNFCPYCNSRLDVEKTKQDKEFDIRALVPVPEPKGKTTS